MIAALVAALTVTLTPTPAVSFHATTSAEANYARHHRQVFPTLPASWQHCGTSNDGSRVECPVVGWSQASADGSSLFPWLPR